MADSGEPGPSGGAAAKTPADFLKSIKGKPVIVKLNSGVDYRGEGLRERGGEMGRRSCAARLRALSLSLTFTPPHPTPCTRAGVLACLDGYMNIAMEQTEEFVNGQLKNKYGDCFIRGNNGAASRGVRGACGWRAAGS